MEFHPSWRAADSRSGSHEEKAPMSGAKIDPLMC